MNPPFDPHAATVELPPIPGDWGELELEIAGQRLTLTIPRSPDDFLDDPRVLEANRENDYMPYWSFLWPAAPPMARAMQQAPWPRDCEVLEIGAGLGVVGLACQLRGHRVTYSDYDSTSLAVCRHNARRNGLPQPHTLLFDWRDPPQTQFPVIIGCEVTYDPQLHAPLLEVIDRMLMADGICWLGDPGRYHAGRFQELARQRGFVVRILDEQGTEYPATRENQFQITELCRAPAAREQ